MCLLLCVYVVCLCCVCVLVQEISHDTKKFRFGLPSAAHILGLPVGTGPRLILSLLVSSCLILSHLVSSCPFSFFLVLPSFRQMKVFHNSKNVQSFRVKSDELHRQTLLIHKNIFQINWPGSLWTSETTHLVSPGLTWFLRVSPGLT